MARPDDDSATEIIPSATAPGIPASAATGEPASLIGRALGKFTIVELLGQGGSGEVYRAEQQPLGRSAVIKVLRREIANVPNRIERFLREAKLASRLDHPYAAHVYAFGAEPDGVLWIAMEHVRGATLDELIAQRGALHAAVFAPLFGRLCEVVHTAHELGIVHSDIKGSNVMVIERAEAIDAWLEWTLDARAEGAGPSVAGFRALAYEHGEPVWIDGVLDEIPDDWLAQRRKQLIRRLLGVRVKMLQGLAP